ncbi:uncharacterized protein LOC127730652 isoform X2 [Mytilus californianus]|uniref:uncharacterized protein LOC127730652 isoform X2 n=1 Tax=Mytilus californianus TaxID=6549 RepID=UPI002248673B|nr:uncharacterized protein LOC127730652 isoform X2 [Mytilus californianus]
MSSDDIKMILRKFYIALRTNVTPCAVIPVIDGLTVFDRQQIQATAKMDGDMLGNDKLIDTLGRRTTRTFLSFVTVLQEYNHDLAFEIIQYTRNYFPHIHTSIQNFQQHHNQIPSATVRPSVASSSDAQNYPLERHSIHERTTINQRSDVGSQAFIIREESTDTYTRAAFNVQPFQRTSEVRQVTFYEDTLLEDVPNVVFLKWAAELNKEDNWKKLADVISLSRKAVRELRNKSNPGEEILDILCNKEEVTVRGLIHLLESAELTESADIVKESLGVYNERPNQTSIETQTSNPDSSNSDSAREQSFPRTQQTDKNPQEMPTGYKHKQLNIDSSDSSINSQLNNEEVDESSPRGAEGGNKTMINNLNRSEYKFSMVKEVHIHLSGDSKNDESVKDPDEKKTSVSANNVPSNDDTPLSQGHNIQAHSKSTDQNISLRNTGIVEDHHENPTDKFFRPNSTGHFVVEEDQQSSLDRLLISGGHVLGQPTSDVGENVEKNCEQEYEALNVDFLNQPNLDSYRNIRTSIPSEQLNQNLDQQVRSSEHENGLLFGQERIQHPEFSSTQDNNFEKNLEQEYEALNRDIGNQ